MPAFIHTPMAGISDPNAQSFRALFSSGTKFEVPKFQRDYSWEEEHWDDLWQDILSLHSKEDCATSG